MDSNENPVCKGCFRTLPMQWAGIDYCPWCLHLSKDKQLRRRKWRTPGYRTPLTYLQKEDHGNTDG